MQKNAYSNLPVTTHLCLKSLQGIATNSAEDVNTARFN